jgi:hypothetical protein
MTLISLFQWLGKVLINKINLLFIVKQTFHKSLNINNIMSYPYNLNSNLYNHKNYQCTHNKNHKSHNNKYNKEDKCKEKQIRTKILIKLDSSKRVNIIEYRINSTNANINLKQH